MENRTKKNCLHLKDATLSKFVVLAASIVLIQHCAQPIQDMASKNDTTVSTSEIHLDYVAVYPVPHEPNVFVDTNVQTNGTSYWKTITELNDYLPVHSGECFIKGVIASDAECHKPGVVNDPTVAWDLEFKQVYKVNIGRVYVGDVFEVLGQIEVTNSHGSNPGVNTVVVASTNSDARTPVEAFIVVPENGENCLHTIHHCVQSKIGTLYVTPEMAAQFGNNDVYIILAADAYFHGGYSTLNGVKIIIEQGYGSLSVIKRN